MTSEKKFTQRGFGIIEFNDYNGEKCSLQKSSVIADEECVWLGCDEIGLKKFIPHQGWFDVPLENDISGISHIANNRMHLTQSQVQDLLPQLTHFADTGELL